MWISIKDELPPMSVPLIITNGEALVTAERINDSILAFGAHGFAGDEWEFAFDTTMTTHWMLAPELPAK